MMKHKSSFGLRQDLKLTFLLFMISVTLSFGNAKMQSINLNYKGTSLKKVLVEISKISGYTFIYDENELKGNAPISVRLKNKTIHEVLDRVLDKKEYTYKIKGKSIAITAVKNDLGQENIQFYSIDEVQSQRVTISGKVTDENQNPLIGVSIAVQGSSDGTSTDEKGSYSLTVPAETKTLSFSLIGFSPQNISVDGRSEINVVLIEQESVLEEIVVTALGIKREEKALGYAVQKVKGETLSTIKGVSVATSLTGKIAGVNVRNSTEFGEEPSILLRGKSPLIVIDEIPYSNTSLADIPADDIEEITVLKGPGASALYGSRGGNGAIMITTKRGKKEGLTVAVNSNTMFNAGHIRIPRPQTSYSTGNNGKYDRYDFVWGDKMDIGRTAVQYDPYTYEWREMPLESKGKNNFANFLQTAAVTNNNASFSYKAKNGSLRASLNHIYNKGQYPNLESNKYNYNISGQFEVDKFKFDGGIAMNHFDNPQNRGAGYGATGYIYNFLVWTGTDFDVRDFRNYWQNGKENEKQNWWNPGWYDNPYFIAYERTAATYRNKTSSHFSATYSATNWLKTMARLGHDYYSNRFETRTPLDTRGNAKGAYSISNNRGYSLNADLIAMTEHQVGDLSVNGLLGGSIYFYEDDGHSSSTNNGLSIPGFYSLNASVDPVSSSSSVSKRQLNSFYGQVNFGWKGFLYLDLSGRNDWVSTLEKSERSYFYPGADLSFIPSEIMSLPDWMTYWKLRSSWSVTKTPAGIYDINSEYSISKNLWNNMNGALFPTSMRDKTIKPQTKSSWEVGTEVYFLNNRMRFDIGYYQELLYNLQRNATVSSASGFSNVLVNYGEEQQRKGIEVTLEGDVVKKEGFEWTSTLNWALDRYYYHKIDENYSTDRPWVAPGKRWDWMGGVYDWERDPEGNIVHLNGKPKVMQYERGGYNEFPDWVWGFSNIFKYKSFTVTVSLDGRVGGYGYDQTEQAMWNSGTHPDSDNIWRYDQVVEGKTNYIGEGVKVVSGSVKYDKYGRIEEDTRVFEKNDVAIGYQEYIQEYHPWSGNSRIQNIKKMTFFKLRELGVGYTLPNEIANKARLNDVQLSLVGQNLFIWSPNFKHSDPDIHSNVLNSPSVRYLGFNVKFTF